MTYTKDNLRQIFQQPFNQQEWQTMLRSYFHATELKAAPERIEGTADDEQGYYLGAIDTTDSYCIGLFYYKIQHGNVARKRVGLRNLVKSFVNPNWGEFDAALVVFDSGTLWRLSFVCDIKGENTAAKRFTYVFGESDNYYNTPVGRFDALQRNGISFENIKDAFSVERLNKDFFNGYKERYVKFLKHINDDTKENRDYVKKLLGRLVFLQFLQKKGWMGVPANQQGWNGGDKFYLNHLIESYEGNDRLLSDVLEPLFFNTLNERRTNGLADPRLGDNIKIPYLNGGLFDKDELDKKDIDFPYDYFKELMDFFAMYNFTIDENDPEDSEIGIDPEMLGHIFENLLEDNKDKGAFYTPKEIVQYMSKESVSQYLKSYTPEELHTAIDSLIKQRVVEPVLQKKENTRLVNSALTKVKVCDPAIGSGAFPMGVLNVLFDCRHLLYGFIGVNEVFSYAKVKRDIIQNNIYGVDIEKGAVDIARLRFWLALVVDENEPQPLPNLDYKIMCGDSLLHRFALDAPFTNVLRDYNQKNGTQYTLDDYRQWVYDYTDISDHTQKYTFRQKIEDIKRAVKTELSDKEKGKIAKVRGTIANLQMEDMFGGKKKENEKKIKALQKELKALEQQREEIESNKIYEQAFEWRFEFPALLDDDGNFTGFDIVIGNPPYGAKLEDDEKQVLKKKYDVKTSETAILFIEGGLKLLTPKGIQTYIIPKAFTYASNYEKIRNYVERDLSIIVDCGKAFEKVKLEACIILNSKSVYKNKYENLRFTGENFVSTATIEKTTKSIFGFFLNGVNENYINLGIKIKTDSTSLGDISTNNRGEALQGELFSKGLFPVIGGKDIDRRNIRGIKGFLADIDTVGANAVINSNSVLFQNIVAHITDPYPQIKLIGCVPNRNDVYLVDTINQISFSDCYSNKFLWCLLNSKLICWYVYNFIYGQAIRTMHFDSVSTNKIPVKFATDVSPFEKLWKEFVETDKDNTMISDHIDLLVYHLYGLTYDEVLIVDPGTPITQEEYNNNK